MLPQLVALAAIGATHDALCATYINAANGGRRVFAAVISGILTAFGYLAWWLIESNGLGSTPVGVLAYAAGGALGTYFALGRTRPESAETRPKVPQDERA